MRRYETIAIIDPDLSDEERQALFEKIGDIISQQKGLLVLFDKWGSRKLSYAIKKKTRGYYVRIDYCGTGKLVDEIERLFRIDDRVLKFMTVLLAQQVDIEAVKEEMAIKKAEEEQAAQRVESDSVIRPPETVESEGESLAIGTENQEEVQQNGGNL